MSLIITENKKEQDVYLVSDLENQVYGVFSSLEEAEKYVNTLEYPTNFWIDRYELNEKNKLNRKDIP